MNGGIHRIQVSYDTLDPSCSEEIESAEVDSWQNFPNNFAIALTLMNSWLEQVKSFQRGND